MSENTPFVLAQQNFSAYNALVDADAALLFKQAGQIVYIISVNLFYYWDGLAWTTLGDGTGITNSAGANVIVKSNGTNIVASHITDDGTTIVLGGTNVQLSPLSATTVPYLDSSKNLVSSSVTPTELGYLSGVTSSIQTQLGLKTVQSLTQSTTTLTWNVSLGQNATVTLTQSVSTFTISNSVAGDYYTIKVIQGGAGSYTLALPASSKVTAAGGGVVTLSTAVSSIDILTAYYDGTNYFWSYGVSFS